MKRILLASTALVALAGAAAAEVTWDGDAEIGYNDDFDDGFFWSVGLTLNLSMELDNGLTASVTGDVGTESDTDPASHSDIDLGDIVVTLASETASLSYGDTPPAADAFWSSPVTNLDGDSFNDEGDIQAAFDAGMNANASLDEDGVLIGRVSFGASEVGVSYYVIDANEATAVNDDILGLQFGFTTTFGNFDIVAAYQDDDNPNGEIFALGVSTTFGDATIGFAYADEDMGQKSIGIQVAYTWGPVTVTAFGVSQDPVDDNYGLAIDYAEGPITLSARYHDGNDEEAAVEGTYDLGNGLSFFAGYVDEMETGAGVEGSNYFYVGGDYDLGGGAVVRFSYADIDVGPGDDLTRDELGAAEDVKEGVTLAVSFTF